MSKAVLTRYEVTTEYPVPQALRIAHVSDLHSRIADDILEMLKEQKPDFIVITGDTFERYDNRPQYEFKRRPVKRAIINAIHYTNWFLRLFESEKKKARTEYAQDFLRRAVKIAPVYMCLGNHEQKLLDSDYRFLTESGVTLLENRDIALNVKGCELLLGGAASWDFELFLEGFALKRGLKILLFHHPERFETWVADTDIALMLSGHTHGGQVRIGKKGMGFFVPGQGLFGKLAHGQFFNGRLIVSAGCSNTVAMPRFFNPRELVMITLKGKNDAEL